MKKLLMTLAVFLCISHAAQSEEVYITNNSDYDVAIRTSSDWTLSFKKWSLIPAKETALIEVDDHNPTTFRMYRRNLKAALSNTFYLTTRLATAETLAWSNVLFWVPAAYSTVKTCYKGCPFTSQTIDPKNNKEGFFQHIVIQNYSGNDATIESKIEEIGIDAVFGKVNEKWHTLFSENADFILQNQEYSAQLDNIISMDFTRNSCLKFFQFINDISKALKTNLPDQTLDGKSTADLLDQEFISQDEIVSLSQEQASNHQEKDKHDS